MKYTCKDCLTIMKEHGCCPICNSTEKIVPIQINLHSSVKKVHFINNNVKVIS